MLTIIEVLPPQEGRRDRRLRCKCHCGNEVIVRKDNLKRTKSCGCERGKRNDLGVVPQTPKPEKAKRINRSPEWVENKQIPKIEVYIEEDSFNQRKVKEALQRMKGKYRVDPKDVADKLGVKEDVLYDMSSDELEDKLRAQGAEI
jgi:hypothetical protein